MRQLKSKHPTADVGTNQEMIKGVTAYGLYSNCEFKKNGGSLTSLMADGG